MHLGPEPKIVEEESHGSIGCINITANASNVEGYYLLEDDEHRDTQLTNFAEFTKNIHESFQVPLHSLIDQLEREPPSSRVIEQLYMPEEQESQLEQDQQVEEEEEERHIMAHSPTPAQELMPDFHDQLVNLNKRGMECLSQGNFKESQTHLKLAEQLINNLQVHDQVYNDDFNKLFSLTINNLGCYYKK